MFDARPTTTAANIDYYRHRAAQFRAQVQRLKTMSSLATSLPPQIAVAEYLAQGHLERHLRRLRAALADQQVQAQAGVERHFPAGTRMTRPAGGYFLWLELPAQVDAQVACIRLLAFDRHVLETRG